MLLRLDNKPRTHDYTRMMWGHALQNLKMIPVYSKPTIWDRLRGKKPEHVSNDLTCTGHGSVRKGDSITIEMASGKIAKWLVEDIEQYRDPDDMFKIRRASFVEYVTADV